MRVCMLSYSFYEGDNRVRRYAEALVKRGDTVDIIAIGRPGQLLRETISGVSLFRIQSRRINERGRWDYLVRILVFLFHSFAFLTRRHLLKPYQLIHVHNVPDFEVFAAVAAKLTGAAIILDIHDILPEFFSGKFSGGKTTKLIRTLMLVEKISCAFANHVIISNHIWGERLVSRSVRREKCSVMLNYPDATIFRGDLPHPTGGPFTMIYPGTLSEHQGLDIAIRALSLVKAELAPFQFNIYGRGSQEQSLKDLALSLGLQESVVFHGVFPLDVVAAKMALSDLGVIPKRADGFGNEAFSTKIFEFMSLHVPVLISSTLIDRYYFNNSVAMFFESGNERELAERILFLARNKPARDALATSASAFIKQFSWDVRKNEYFALVDSLTSKKRRKLWHTTPAPAAMPLSLR